MDRESQESTATRDEKLIVEQRVGTAVQKLRAERRWSLQDLAKRSGISTMQLSRIERLESSPTEAKIRSLAKAFDIPVSMLFGEDPLEPALNDLMLSLQLVSSRAAQARNQVRSLQLIRRYGATSAREVAQRGERLRTIATAQGRTLVIDGETSRVIDS